MLCVAGLCQLVPVPSAVHGFVFLSCPGPLGQPLMALITCSVCMRVECARKSTTNSCFTVYLAWM